ncbi:MFS transporter [Lachnoclostridium sp. Marseille-P6806]|uniref:MFS transporter n=1 Tax=Lachnoclostridium sp. Marseille-P6806 TaxID=2364793 RepID=UPI001031F6B7|nr:MFS transporter [Lachnoclostridium sp. Marseille-P6806]
MNNQTNGMHRARLWQIGGFALNNTATNLYLFFMNFIVYYLVGFVGVAVVLGSTVLMGMRMWDGVTDPFIGYIVDKTNTRFGKNRPFMIIGNVILALFSFLMITVSHRAPEGARFFLFIGLYMVYIVGYTFQCVVTKSAQTCLTNDPKQRPIFTIFDGIYNTVLFAFMPWLVAKYLQPKYGGFELGFFREFWMITAGVSAIFTIIAVISISSKDRTEYFGLGIPQKISVKDYWEVLSRNRAIQMLVVSASTDKLALTTQSNSTVGVMLYAIVCGNYGLSGSVAAYTAIPTFLILMFGVGYIARYLGQRKAMLFGTYGALITCILSILSFYIFDPTTLSLPGEGFTGWNAFTVIFLTLYLLMKGFTGVSGNIVIPMTADCADYEVYRSGKYVPGLMGTLFSCVDKLISSVSVTIIGLLCAAIGFKTALPDVDTPYSGGIKLVAMICMYGLLIFGLICNIIAMRFYPLTKEKMESIQGEIARIKAEQAAGA